MTGGIIHTVSNVCAFRARINGVDYYPSKTWNIYTDASLYFMEPYLFAVGDTLEIRTYHTPSPITLASNANSFLDMIWLGVE